MDYFILPVFVSLAWMFGVFFLALLLFHVPLVWSWQLDKTGWKRVDYIWLSFALLGVLAEVGSARQMIASELVHSAGQFADNQARWIVNRIDAGVSEMVCRRFEPSEPFPRDAEFDRYQQEFDELCAWFGEAKLRIADGLPAEIPLSLETLGGRAAPAGADPWMVTSLEDAVSGYNEARQIGGRLRAQSEPSKFEFFLLFIEPSLIAIAVALRMTKVTGELRLKA